MPEQNNQFAHDVVAYTRRKPQYVRPRMRMPATASNQSGFMRVVRNQSMDGVFQGQQTPLSPSENQKIEGQTPNIKYFDIVLKPKTTQANPREVVEDVPEAEDVPVKQSRWRLVPAFAAVSVLIVGFGIFALTLRTNQQVMSQVSASEVKEDEEAPPTEEEISEEVLSSHRVSPNAPRLLSIESLSIRSRIMRLGTLPSGTLAAPANIFDAGWYEGSSEPGEGGAVLLVGHVHGPTKPGVFKDLHTIQEGETITITRGDGVDVSYRVTRKKQVATEAVNMAEALVPVTPGKNGLNIITCAGEIIPGTTKYADRIIVYAEEV